MREGRTRAALIVITLFQQTREKLNDLLPLAIKEKGEMDVLWVFLTADELLHHWVIFIVLSTYKNYPVDPHKC